MRKLMMLIILMLGFISCDKFGDNRDLVNYISTGIFHDTWGDLDNQSSISWDITPISADHVRNDITYLKVFINSYYVEYNYSEVMSDEEFIHFMKNIERKEKTSDIVQINDSIRCTWNLFYKVYNTYIK